MHETGQTRGKLGGACIVIMGVIYVLLAVTHLASPAAQRLSAGPEAFWPSIAHNPIWSLLVNWEYFIIGVLSLAAVPAVTERVRAAHPEWAAWARSLGILGYAAMTLRAVTQIGRVRAIGDAYLNGSTAVKEAIAALPLLPLDAHGWLGFGAVGAWAVTLSLLSLRGRAYPPVLNGIGLAVGGLNWLMVAGWSFGSEALVSAAAAAAVLVTPVWFVGLGLVLRRTGIGSREGEFHKEAV